MRFKVGAAVSYRRYLPQAIGKKAQWPLRGNTGVQLAHGPCCCVARVDKSFFTFHALGNLAALAFIEGFKIVATHVDLTAHFQHCRDRQKARARVRLQAKRDLPNRANVLRHVFACFAVAPGGSLQQHAVFIAQAHGQAVKFQLRNVFNRWIAACQTQFFADPGVEVLRAAGFGVGFSANAEHGHFVLHAGKLAEGSSTYALRGRVRALQLRVRRFKRLQFRKKPVVFRVWNLRIVKNVITAGMFVDLGPQFLRLARCQR